LRCDAFFTLDVDEVGIDVVFDVVFLVRAPKKHAGGLEGHILRVTIQFVLFRVLVQLLEMVLGLGHKS